MYLGNFGKIIFRFRKTSAEIFRKYCILREVCRIFLEKLSNGFGRLSGNDIKVFQ